MFSQNQKGLKDPQFADLLQEHRDHARHMYHSASEVNFYMCCNDNPCAECTDVIKKRQEKQPGWSPRKVLRLLEWNNYRLPHAELIDEALYPPLPPAPALAADAPVVNPVDDATRPAETGIRRRLAQASAGMAAALAEEEYLRADAHKQQRDALISQLSGLREQAVAPKSARYVAPPTERQSPWACRAAEFEFRHNWAYKSWTDLWSQQRPQTVVRIPIPLETTSRERLLVCDCGQYVAKTMTELNRHVTTAHGRPPKVMAVAAPPPTAGILEGYSAVGCVPVIRSAKRRRVAAGVACAEGMAEEDFGLEDMDLAEDLDPDGIEEMVVEADLAAAGAGAAADEMAPEPLPVAAGIDAPVPTAAEALSAAAEALPPAAEAFPVGAEAGADFAKHAPRLIVEPRKDLAWFWTAGATGKTHFIAHGRRQNVPVCFHASGTQIRNTQSEGKGLEEVIATSARVCDRCFAVLPERLRKLLVDSL